MVSSDGADVEKHAGVTNLYEDNTGAVAGESFEYGSSVYAKLQRFAGKLHVEQRGIERVPEDERTDTSYLNIGSMVRYIFHTFNFSLKNKKQKKKYKC